MESSAHFLIKDLSVRYHQKDKTVFALEKISLTIEDRDIFGVIGPSGAGKSTLIRSLAGLVCPAEGQLFFRGQEICTLKGKERKNFHRSIGMIFQHFNLMSARSVGENVAYPLEVAGLGKEKRKQRVQELLGFVGLLGKKDSYPAMLSGGEKQRVGIARALANNAKTLLCDEATSALDPSATEEILALLQNVQKTFGVTIVLITHDMDVIKAICNKLAVIEAGKIIEEGLVADVFAEPKSETTKRFIQTTSHRIPKEFFPPLSPERKLLRLRFKGDVAKEPIISTITRKFEVDANILLGWIDKLQSSTVGTLVIELMGKQENIQRAEEFLRGKSIYVEEVSDG